MKRKTIFPLITLALLSVFVSCKKNDDVPQGEKIERSITIKNVGQVKDYAQSGTFRGDGTPPVILPGKSVEIKFYAGNGQTLAFATMYGLSKDWFFAPMNPGLKLFDENKKAIVGDVSDQIRLWDNGTKDNTTGVLESKLVSEVMGIKASDLMKLTLSFDEEKSEFTLTILNTSAGTGYETPFSPGVWVVSNIFGGELLNSNPFFEANKVTNPEITAIAEKGDNTLAAAKAILNTGLITGLSPIVVVTYNGIGNPIFKVGEKDRGQGLKNIAQKGDSQTLVTYLKGLKGVKEVYVLGSAPIAPGQQESNAIKGVSSDKVAFVTMYGYSNDWFFANSQEITLSSKGDLTSKVQIFDNGTAKDQFPGAGNAQGLFGGIPFVENNVIQVVGQAFNIPAASSFINVTMN